MSKYRRVLLKMSGEALSGDGKTISPAVLERMSGAVKKAHDDGVELALVIGGGNIFRGVARALRHLEKGRVVIFAAGTGNPYFTTDTAASLRAMEIGAEVILKATKVDGIYDKDPVKHADARRYRTVSFKDAIEKQLRVMDATAFSLCRENNMPIILFSMNEADSFERVLAGEDVGTRVGNEDSEWA